MLESSTFTKHFIHIFTLPALHLKFTLIHGQESAEKNETDTFYIGPCAWVLSNRKCPDADIKFYLYTRSNPDDRQAIHIDGTWETSNISASYYNPKFPVKIIIHGEFCDKL